MNIAEVRERLTRIEAMSGDSEIAHMEQDKFLLDVLQAVADGAYAPEEIAVVALEVQNIKFTRWYA